ncbi:MAG: RdgB/HAM1 family non-canonical purine NTP pyrophosphatase [Candidatus Omnitrophica bacterium]|nr:RdgB/HAM1 family non-canonical purine NTP pyrophosphatase [Candidatus Omnitrophota bacterium]MBU1852742.1 RdgB/HAM1 family non-canonical purine NTP pyrophosphatase [Candidatus Omnitrophota bacterium]
MRELIVATRNQDKLKEIKLLLKGLPLKVISLNSFKDVPQVKEDGNTLEANAIKKAIQVSRFLKKLVVADDSGLEIAFLGNMPGVYSARFSGKGATYDSNNKKVLMLLKDVPSSKRNAQFRCCIAIADKGRLIGIVEGGSKGRIGFKAIGKSGFGYDPIFIPYGYKETFAQLGMRKKNKISHRNKALVQAKKVIKRYINGKH